MTTRTRITCTRHLTSAFNVHTRARRNGLTSSYRGKLAATAITATFFSAESVLSWCCSSHTSTSLLLLSARSVTSRMKNGEKVRLMKGPRGRFEDDVVDVEYVEVGGLELLGGKHNHYIAISSLH